MPVPPEQLCQGSARASQSESAMVPAESGAPPTSFRNVQWQQLGVSFADPLVLFSQVLVPKFTVGKAANNIKMTT